LVHNAAVQPCTPIIETSLAEWNETLAVNLTAAFLGVRYMAPLMAGRTAAIVHVASVHSLATSAGMAAYVASKGGLLAFTRAAALELAGQNIRVNAVLPGAVYTPMLEQGLNRSTAGPAQAREKLISQTPLQRLGSPDEIARSIAFLLDSEQSSFITGQTLVADGGVLARLASE
jgi:NAD(P)-dependent dehydrogenase (short-subunit alcohol dehydrogenase family)